MKTHNLKIAFCRDLTVLDDKAVAGTFSSCDAVVFPELVDGGYAKLKSHTVPHRVSSTLIQQIKNFSLAFPAVCISGSLHFQHSHQPPTNTSLIFQSGRIISSYDKIHLFRPTGDHRYFVPGTRMRLFNVGAKAEKIKCGVIICYDLRFPELTRFLAAKGMKILFVPARWPATRDEAWQALLKARAIENQIFVLGCNADGKEGGFSYAFDPTGKKIFSNRGKRSTRVHMFTLDCNQLSNAKRFHDNLKEARLLTALKRSVNAALRQ